MPKRPPRSRGSRACLRLSVRSLGHRYAPHLPPGRTAPSRSATHLSCAAWSTAAAVSGDCKIQQGVLCVVPGQIVLFKLFLQDVQHTSVMLFYLPVML